MQAKATEYARLRDEGMTSFDAARQLGVSDRTVSRYERWYRDQRGLPAKLPSAFFGER
jgi:hypothetical protein